MKAPVTVFGLGRSGNHFAMALLWHNFELPSAPPGRHGAPYPGCEFQGWDGTRQKATEQQACPWHCLTLDGNHNMRRQEFKGDPQRLIYLVRHPVRRAISMWRAAAPDGSRPWQEFISEAAMQQWAFTVSAWVRDCFWVRYEDLAGAGFRQHLARIQRQFRLAPRRASLDPLPRRVGWFAATRPVQSKEPSPQMMGIAAAVIPEGYLGYSFHVSGHPAAAVARDRAGRDAR